MNEPERPVIKKRSGPSLVWLIPAITALVGAWLVVKTLSEQGPVATISFKTAEGIEVGKTRVKYKNVNIGLVDAVNFSEDLTNVVVTVEFDQGTEHFLKRNTRFWVVKPQLSVRGVSGLSTLISGAYIEIDPGPGAEQLHFVGLETPPVVTATEAGKRLTLVTDKLASLDRGSPIYYQGMQAGEVLGYELGNDRKSVYLHVFIEDPFDQLIRGNTRFWNVSGIEVSLDSDGFKMETESLASLVYGGVAFETPDAIEEFTNEVDDLVFTLFDDYESIKEYSFTHKINFLLFFNNSVRGLNIGAPVEFQGIKVGSVLDVRLQFDQSDTSFRIPVLIEIEPERIIERNTSEERTPADTLASLIEGGLRARLQTGSLLTGQLYVELSMQPDTEALLVDEKLPYPQLPTLPTASFGSITASLEDFLSKLNAVELDKIGEELLSTLEGTSSLVNAPEIQGSLGNVQQSLESLRSILNKVDQSNIEEVINSANNALLKMDETLTLTNKVLKPNSPLQYNVIKMTAELEETARTIRSLVETLERNPNMLIFGKGEESEEANGE